MRKLAVTLFAVLLAFATAAFAQASSGAAPDKKTAKAEAAAAKKTEEAEKEANRVLEEARERARATGHRTFLVVPLIHEGSGIGALSQCGCVRSGPGCRF